jgi:serine/threonine-protein kinase
MLKGVCESPPLLVSELAEGGHLRRYLAERDWDFGIGVVLLKQVAHGMEYLHNLPKEIIHGDLKPENVLIDATGIAKIADFGLSRATDPTAPGQPACIPGTPGYIGPEVYDGVFDLPTDVFAWSMIAIEVVSEGNRQVLFRNRYEVRL